jgi:putative transposase
VHQQWLERTGVRTLYIEPGSPWEIGYCETFNGKLRDEVLDREIFYTLREAQVIIERWRVEYNSFRPHSSLNYRPPAPEAILTTWIVQTKPEDPPPLSGGKRTTTLT